ncbi:aldo/keto reductase [Synechococcus sp. LTW-G]
MRATSSPQQMAEVLDAALAAGINHIETAPAYGPAEAFLGQALRARPPGELVLTSKLLPGISLEEGQTQLRGILQRLGVQQLDNLAVHGLNRREHLDWALKGEGADLLQWAMGEGLVTQVGFSSHGELSLIEAALASARFSFCSLHLHWFDQTRLPLAQAALREGIGVLAISPADKGGRLYAPPEQLRADCDPFEPLELAYRFLLDAGISCLTLGAAQSSDLALAQRLMVDKEIGLEPSHRQALERAWQAGQARLAETACQQCRACLPCPNEVPIPELLRLRNLDLGHGLSAFAQERYNLIGRAGHWWESVNAFACEGCGECLPRCPHQLPIPELLAETHQRLAAAPRRRLWG